MLGAVTVSVPTPSPSVPTLRSPLLYGIAVLWLLVWTLVSLVEVAALLHTPRVPRLHPIGIILISPAVVGSWLVWALATRRFERVPVDPPRAWLLYQLRALPLLYGCIPLVWILRQAFYELIGRNYGGPPTHLMIPYEVIKVTLFYGIWVALMFGLLTLAKRREDSEQILAMQKALVEAQLAQLQAQLRPHFLFNALNTVSSLMQTDPARADRVLSELGDLLRANLAAARRDPVPLREELKVLRQYADIMQERFGERAVVSWDVATDALDVPTPPMLLQPLLENAYKHGVERNTDLVRISIAAARNGDSLQVRIHNTGSSLGAETTSGVGLRNCHERLRLLYGTTAELRVEDDGTGGVQAIVRLPCPAPAA
jgi:hypothetical protein